MSTEPATTWIITIDSTTCRIYDYQIKPAQVTLIKKIEHLENKLRDIELTSDKPGHYQGGISSRGAFSQQSDPKKIKIDNFSNEIAKELTLNKNKNAYHHLIIIAAPHMNGLLFQHLNKHVEELVSHSIKKDVMQLNERELLKFVQEHTLSLPN